MKKKIKAAFVSDVHLGSPFAQDKKLLAFLKTVQPETLYLVGDIIDGWALQRSWYWPSSHTDLLREFMKQKNVIYTIGNHDEFLNRFVGQYGNIAIVKHCVHTAVDGKRYLVIHGDLYDLVVKNSKWLAHLGDWGYDRLLGINRVLAKLLAAFGYHWSLSAWVKANVKAAVNFISGFQRALMQEAKRAEADGVICGHIHKAAQEQTPSGIYMNTGDWVESCTAIIEEMDGTFRMIV